MSAKGCKLLIAGWMLLVFARPAPGSTTRYVDDDNCPGPGAGTQGDPFCSIQRGIDEAVNGDEVLVAPGTYNETINFNGKAITLRAFDGPDVTIIDATGVGFPVVRCVSGEPPETILRGFTITGGHGFGGSSGGMLIFDSSPTILECVFLENSLTGGGPVDCCGAGMHIDRGSPTVVNCQFIGNRATPFSQCTPRGGGICNKGGSPLVTGCTFVANISSATGGGMFHAFGNPIVANCTFVGNEAPLGGAGIIIGGTGSAKVTNCILWSNTPDQILANSSPSPVSFSGVQGGFPGVGNIDLAPLFVDAPNGDLRLLIKSPCIDAGDNTALPKEITTDLAGNPRFVDTPFTPDTGNGTPPIVDMGAYEFQGRPENIPTLSLWGMVATALLLVTAGTAVLRSRRYRGALRPVGAFVALVGCPSMGTAQVQLGPQIRIDVNGGTAAANETSIASSNFNPNEIVAAWNDWRETPPLRTRSSASAWPSATTVVRRGPTFWSDHLPPFKQI